MIRIFSFALMVAMSATAAAQTQTYSTSDQYLMKPRTSAPMVNQVQPTTAPRSFANTGYANVQSQPVAPSYPSGGCDSYAAGGCDGGGCAGGGCDGGGCAGGGCDGNVGQNYLQGGCDSGCGGGQSGCNTGGCGKYTKFFGGWNGAQDMVALIPNNLFEERISFKPGYVTGMAFGRQIDCNRRHELEFAFRDNSSDESITRRAGAAVAAFDVVGEVQAYSGMKNFIFNIGNGGRSGIQPYIGGGLGVAYVDGNIFLGNGTSVIEDWAFAYQAMVGLEKQLSSRVSLFAEYRYFATDDVEVQTFDNGGNLVFSFEDEYMAENVIFGVTIKR